MPALLVLLALTILKLAAGETGYPIAKPRCPDRCGNMSIPYPFGIADGCYFSPDFNITCGNDSSNMAFLIGSDFPIKEIMLLSGEARFLLPIAHLCNSDGSNRTISSTFFSSGGTTYTLSYSKNRLTVVGCDALGWVGDNNATFRTGCFTGCGSIEGVVDGSCDGIGCCQFSVPKRTTALTVSVSNYSTGLDACNSAFLVEQAAYKFTSLDLMLPTTEVLRKPVIFDWSIGNKNCTDSQNQAAYVCGENSVCVDYDNGVGYRCNCSDGFQGNPYLGCQDIDECTLSNPCTVGCINSPGNFSCIPCQKGYIGDGYNKGYNNGTGCLQQGSLPPNSPPIYVLRYNKILGIGLGTSIGAAMLFLGCGVYFILQKRKLNQLRKKYYKENGGFTLQHLLSQHERQLNSFKIYTACELEKATHSYDESNILGKGGQGTVYKGELVDNTIVAIKKSNAIDKSQVNNFVNEIVILSQTNHQNVVKLVGCCLETEIPMLVYEFITNGTLSDYIRKDSTPQMPWHTRARIAAEIAGAISYLHTEPAVPIIHRDIKTANILLDVGYTAKVSDFGLSKFSHIDKTLLATHVLGTLGYLDPEYHSSGILSEKSDVYSFGVVLLELLSGAKPINTEWREGDKSLAYYFMSCMKEGRLDDIVDDNLKRNVKHTQLEEVALLAARCLNEKGKDRPSMNEVARVLERVAKREIVHPWVAIDVNEEQEIGVLLPKPLNEEQDTGILLRGSVRSNSVSKRSISASNSITLR